MREMVYDIDAVRSQFPALRGGTVFFDGPGGTQTPAKVAAAISAAMVAGLSNRDRGTATGRRADDIVVASREAIGDLVASDPRGVVFGRSMTALTYDLARTLAKEWVPGDEVVVSSLDHDANIRPWVHAAEAVGAVVRWAHFDPATAELSVDAVREHLGERTKVVAVTAASNVLGTRPDIAGIARAAHEVGALMHVDAVHLAPHALLDREALGADFLVCSPYKFFGPHCGVQVTAPALLETLRPDKLDPSPTAVPERFEQGTLPYELLAGVSAAVEAVANLDARATGSRRERLTASFAATDEHESALLRDLEAGLRQIDGMQIFSLAAHRTPTLFLQIEGVSSVDLSRDLAALDINAPSSNFYALEASRRLGLGDAGALRVGLAAYTNHEDVQRLIGGLSEAVTSLR